MSAVLRVIGWVLALGLVLLPVVAVLNGWIGREQWPLTRLHATAPFERVDEKLLQEALLPYAQAGYFAVELDAAQAAVASLPWVEQAEVRKRWPDVLEVRVVEHRPYARWGRDLVLSEQGRLFPAQGIDVPPGLPHFAGPKERVGDVVTLYNESRVLLAQVGMDVRKVALDRRGSWTLHLADGAEIVVGRNEAIARLSRFAGLMPQLLSQQAQVLERADLRYTNGFALSWAPAPEPVEQADAAEQPVAAARHPHVIQQVARI
ncbi:MAG: cell division protein FtsQ/DivIB [Pseudomonadota bacterium]|nr:cell division protein FtsQ/DivIB [Pseudomonadota bacterium]